MFHVKYFATLFLHWNNIYVVCVYQVFFYMFSIEPFNHRIYLRQSSLRSRTDFKRVISSCRIYYILSKFHDSRLSITCIAVNRDTLVRLIAELFFVCTFNAVITWPVVILLTVKGTFLRAYCLENHRCINVI